MKSELILSFLDIPHLLAFFRPIQPTLHFLNSSIWKELRTPLNHKKGKSGAPRATLTSWTRSTVGVHLILFMKYFILSFDNMLFTWIWRDWKVGSRVIMELFISNKIYLLQSSCSHQCLKSSWSSTVLEGCHSWVLYPVVLTLWWVGLSLHIYNFICFDYFIEINVAVRCQIEARLSHKDVQCLTLNCPFFMIRETK